MVDHFCLKTVEALRLLFRLRNAAFIFPSIRVSTCGRTREIGCPSSTFHGSPIGKHPANPRPLLFSADSVHPAASTNRSSQTDFADTLFLNRKNRLAMNGQACYLTCPNRPMNQPSERERISDKLDIGREMLYLTRDEVISTGLGVEEILYLTEQALLAHGTKEYEMPAKIGVHPFKEVFYHAMPAYVPGRQAVGLKWIECYPGNPAKYKLPQTTGLLIINDVLTGCPMALMDATWVTAMRTPAVTALAAASLHPEAKSFAMFGCGVQGIEHCLFVPKTLKSLEKIYIYDTSEAAMENLLETVQPRLDQEIIRCADPETATKAAEVLCSATIILLEPLAVVKDQWVSPGQTILPCDLNTFWDPLTAQRADKYIVDSAEEHRLFADMGYFPDGLPEISCETGEVLAGTSKGRESADELIVCSNIGMAVCDVVVGKEIFMRALEAGIGRKLAL